MRTVTIRQDGRRTRERVSALRRTASLLLVSLLLSLLGVVSSSGTAYATIGTDDYPSNLKTAAQDSVVDPWGFYNRECVSFVAWRLNNDNGMSFSNNMNGGHFGYAYQWKQNAINLFGASVFSGTPAPGAVAWWGQSSYTPMGHVAYVDSVNSDGSINIEQYNAYPYPGAYSTQTLKTTDTHFPDGFLHFKDLPGGGGSIGNGNILSLQNDHSVIMQPSRGASWQVEVTGSTPGTSAIGIGDGILGIVDPCGAVEVKPTPSSSWESLTSCGDSQKIAIGSDGSILDLQQSGGVLYMPQLGQPWQVEASSGGATAIANNHGAIGIVSSCGAVEVKAPATSNWSVITGCGDSKGLAIGNDGSIMDLEQSNTALYMSALGQSWQQQTGVGDAQAIADNDGEVGVISGCGAVLVKATPTSGFNTLTSCNSASQLVIGVDGSIVNRQVDDSVLYKAGIAPGWQVIISAGQSLAVAEQ